MKKLYVALACAARGLSLTGGAHGQQFPAPGKPIRVVVPFAPGGGADTQARIILQATERRGK